jgi:hypothetical protein
MSGDAEVLRARLRRELAGDVLFDAPSRGRYSTDASIYQIEPLGVVVPRDSADALRALEIAADAGVPILPRGAGTSKCGQTVGAALVIDTSKHLNKVLELDAAARTAWVEPGIVLDALNAELKPLGLWHPVDVSTSAQATLGGMTAANNSCGARSLRYGSMVPQRGRGRDLALGRRDRHARWRSPPDAAASGASSAAGAGARARARRRRALALRARRDELEARVPKVARRVAG